MGNICYQKLLKTGQGMLLLAEMQVEADVLYGK